MRSSILLILFVVLASCTSNNHSYHSKNIELFERLLGQDETRHLNDIIAEFDAFMEQKYGGNSDSSLFRTYLFEMETTGSVEFMEFDSAQLFTNLFNSYQIDYPDSVWIDTVINVKYPGLPLETSGMPRGAPTQKQINRLIKSVSELPDIQVTNTSIYFLALDSISNNDTNISSYLENRNALSFISPRLMSGGFLRHLNDDSEYFLKRLFVMELLEQDKLYLLTSGKSHLDHPLPKERRKIRHIND
jgi:hypothetical protein